MSVAQPAQRAATTCLRRPGSHRLAGNTIQSRPFVLRSGAWTSNSLQRCGAAKQNRGKRPLQARAFPPALAAILILGGGIYYLSTPSSSDKTLNTETFVPYTIISREAISPTSFVFTVRPDHPNPSPAYLVPGSSTWRHPLWSVEFKQPEVQIARNYTPLPPLYGEDPATGSLRFYVRAIGGGEMSTYLSRLGVGKSVWLRGPHPGFDVSKRLGDQKHVVFLAGGTGVVPGMQVARAVLDGRADTTFTLLWAVRRREELQRVEPATLSWWGRLWKKSTPEDILHRVHGASPMGRELDEMKMRYGKRLRICVAIDDEKTQFQRRDLTDALQSVNPNHILSGTGCQLHDQRMYIAASEFEPTTPPCGCTPTEKLRPGKNLFMISGPEGFISHYAGQKIWLGGIETQGPVGGVTGELRRNYPTFASDWLVLKL